MLKVTAVGRLSKEIDLSYVGQKGNAVANFNLICKTGVDGQGNDITTNIKCVFWNKFAETLANYTTQGTLIAVEGDLESRVYDKPDGTKGYVTELKGKSFEFLETVAITEQRKQKVLANNNAQFNNFSDTRSPHQQ